MTTPQPPYGGNPYGQPQPQPQPYQGGAPYGQQTPPPPGGPQPSPYFNQPQGGPQGGFPGGYPPPQPQQRSKLKIVKRVVVPVIVLAVAIGAYIASRDDADSAKAGDCMHNSGTNFKPDLEVVDCGSAKAQYTVLKKIDDTSDTQKCTVGDAAYYESGGGNNFVLCLKHK
jgi:hypothetical protein